MSEPEITRLQVTPAPDHTRVRVEVEVADVDDPSPFMELTIMDPEGHRVADMLVMGIEAPDVEMTLHVRPPALEGDVRLYLARARLFYGAEEQKERTVSVAETSFRFT